MSAALEVALWPSITVEIRVRGRVQGVGFRPAVWRLARELGLHGEVLTDGEGVLIRASGDETAIARLIDRLEEKSPPLARLEGIDTRYVALDLEPGFRIGKGEGGAAKTEIAPDAAICPACAAEIFDPYERRFRYPFTTCAQCGPRFSITTAIPHDRAATTMEGYVLCPACSAEYADSGDRRFHAETMACHICGPQAKLVRCDGHAVAFECFSMLDDCDAVSTLLQRGHIVAIKGAGGYQLACDATNTDVVARLSAAKRRESKPLALMARDLDVIRRYCAPSDQETRLLQSPAGPIVLLRAAGEQLPEIVAPGLRTIGLMLPPTPLHLMVLRRMERPVILTSGNAAGEPQIIDDREALACLGEIAEFALVHDRPIAMRVDDSVVRVIGGAPRILRRGRGYTPEPIALPEGFAAAPDLLALGGDLTSAFCLLAEGKAVLSPHIGDLDDALTFDEYRNTLADFARLFHHKPTAIVVDRHPEYRSARLGRNRAHDSGLPLLEVQHHHAHVASCLAENGRALAAAPVLGIVLDGPGWGEDDTLWGGEFLVADYRAARRLGTLKPVAMPGSAMPGGAMPGDGTASREPWRNLYAHLTAAMGWAELTANYAGLDLCRDLAKRPRASLDVTRGTGADAPKASSCVALFDAVAAALGICRDEQGYAGDAAARLEALVCERTLRDEDAALAYHFTIPNLPGSGLPYIEPLAMWRAMLGDLVRKTPAPVVAARFHKGFARAIASMVGKLMSGGEPRFDTVALSGSCFHNKVLFEESARRLRDAGFMVLSHARAPSDDCGLALGQAAIAAARLIAG
ncbi:MAG TPA: carbamoyltransferase HypF [Stellaceae bacterium]|nr:carbamoyltransferase HypF [Stellaceae bacterium]